jgi:hypothetical protein
VRVVGGLGVRRNQARNRGLADADWSATFGRVFAGVDWQPDATTTVNAGVSADYASEDNYDVSVRTGVNWHVADDQTFRLSWSAGNWAFGCRAQPGASGSVVSRERMTSADMGYLLTFPSRNASVDARLFWMGVGRARRGRRGGRRRRRSVGLRRGLWHRGPRHGDLATNWSGFLGASSAHEGDNSGTGQRAHYWLWGATTGLDVKFGDGWQASAAYDANRARRGERDGIRASWA